MQTLSYRPHWKYCYTQDILYYNICLADHHTGRDNLHMQSYMFPLFCNDPCIVQLQYNPFLFPITVYISIYCLQKDRGGGGEGGNWPQISSHKVIPLIIEIIEFGPYYLVTILSYG